MPKAGRRGYGGEVWVNGIHIVQEGGGLSV